MKQFRARKGPFAERPYYELEEIERICAEELRAVDLYPSEPRPIRIERFIERRFKVTPSYEDLDLRTLGYTRFGPNGIEAVVISRALADSGTMGADRCLSATLAHEAGHCLLHGHLFALEGSSSLFENSAHPTKILCRDGDVAGATTNQAYSGRWWEYQANRAIGGLLLPRPLALQCVAEFLTKMGGLGISELPVARREEAARRLAVVFEVNPVVARIRLDDLFPVRERGQLTF